MSRNLLFFLDSFVVRFCCRTRLKHDKISDTYVPLLGERLLSGIGSSPANDRPGRVAALTSLLTGP